MKVQGSHVELDWSEYRADRKRLFWAGILTFPALIICKYLLQFLMPSVAGALTTTAFFLLAVGIDLSLLNNYIFSRCPNCRQPVHRRGNSGDPLSLQCINCGISIGSPFSQEIAPEKNADGAPADSGVSSAANEIAPLSAGGGQPPTQATVPISEMGDVEKTDPYIKKP